MQSRINFLSLKIKLVKSNAPCNCEAGVCGMLNSKAGALLGTGVEM